MKVRRMSESLRRSEAWHREIREPVGTPGETDAEKGATPTADENGGRQKAKGRSGTHGNCKVSLSSHVKLWNRITAKEKAEPECFDDKAVGCKTDAKYEKRPINSADKALGNVCLLDHRSLFTGGADHRLPRIQIKADLAFVD